LEDGRAPAPPLANRAVIMAGGEGRRLRPLTEATPKPMLRVGGTPILELLIERLRQSGIVDVLITLRHKSEMIRDHLGDGGRLGVRIEYVEESEPLGTMGALTLVRGGRQLPILVVNGDILTKCDFRAMLAFHGSRGGAAPRTRRPIATWPKGSGIDPRRGRRSRLRRAHARGGARAPRRLRRGLRPRADRRRGAPGRPGASLRAGHHGRARRPPRRPPAPRLDAPRRTGGPRGALPVP